MNNDPAGPALPDTPRAAGYRMPAEWEPHAATWLAWPHFPDDWPGLTDAVRRVYVAFILHLVKGERVRLLAPSEDLLDQARGMLEASGVPLDPVDLLCCPLNSSWIRDFGPVFLSRDAQPSIALNHFGFTAWARYPDYDYDAQVPAWIADRFDLPRFVPLREGRPVVLEGGSIDTNGHGTLLTTEECLLDQVDQPRNPGMTRTELETLFFHYLGIENTIWLGSGIAGDDTHGHVDDLCRFVGPSTAVLCREKNSRDENHRPLEENRERLESAHLADGSRLEVIELPMPSPVRIKGMRLPASYANFLITNHSVLVPVFDDPQDRYAIGILSELFPGREVTGIHAVDLVWGQGALHCLSCQEPANPRRDSDLRD